MTNSYRAMCAELVAAVDDATESVDRTSDCVNVANYPELWAECMELIRKHDGLLTRARALLALPVAKGPTVMEIIELHTWLEDEWRANNDGEDLPTLDFARAVLAKWGHQ